jgi:archaellum component FlaC
MTALRMIYEYVERGVKELADEKIKGIVKFEKQ